MTVDMQSPVTTDGKDGAADTVVLSAKGLSSGYGSTLVISEINLRVHAGEVIALVGSNGAGKSTTLLTLAGVLSPKQGHVELLGQVVTSPLYQRARAGLGFVPEGRSVVAGLSVEDNLRLATKTFESGLELFPELKPLLKRNAGSLSGGEQQILCLARCLSRHPKVILVDEISLGLAPMVTARVLSALVDVAQSVGVGVVLVEQHVYAAFEASQRAYVLQRGRIVLEGKSMDLIDRIDEIQEVYIAPSDRPNP